jgi:hypothetical protein
MDLLPTRARLVSLLGEIYLRGLIERNRALAPD